MSSYDVELILHCVTFKASHELYSKATLTVEPEIGVPQSFTHIVRHATVSFYEQCVRMKNCEQFRIQLTLVEGVKGNHQQMHTFTVNLTELINKKETRRRTSEYIHQLRCSVEYEVLLKEPNLLEDSSSIDAGKFNLRQQESKERNSQLPKPSFVKQTGAANANSKISQASAGQQVAHSEGASKNDEDQRKKQAFQAEQKQLLEAPNHLPTNSSLKEEANGGRTVARLSPRASNIRRPSTIKPLPIDEIEDQLERILFLRYLSENNNKITTRLSSKATKLKEKIKELKSKKEEFAVKHQQKLQNPGMLGTKAAVIASLLLGMFVSLLYHL